MVNDHGRHFVLSALVFILVLAGSAFAYTQIEGWALIDAVYFVVISATTIGYGDITPTTNVGKILTVFFSFFGIAFAFYYVSLISSYVFKRHLGDKRIQEYTPKTYRKPGPKKPGPVKKKKSKSKSKKIKSGKKNKK